ncbi:unnamed protein product [Albugo candida]|uniref:Pinin/SDK/MemA protein domain-containing protein n=1 Tax=Albugo candida TaxID=65357 RepID=A0A024GSM9_9STRA|nr:unnamed protein product [Albugo candida]|eukprot:CCI49795.1 unnamed protein product [Albugo candida]
MEHERALREELQLLARKRADLNTNKTNSRKHDLTDTKEQSEVPSDRRRSVLDRLGDRIESENPEKSRKRKEWNEVPPRNRSDRTPIDWRRNSFRANEFSAKRFRTNERNGEETHHKLRSKITKPNAEDPSNESSHEETEAEVEQKKNRLIAPHTQKDGMVRNRRLFGSLMNHLGKAKKRIESDTPLFKKQDRKQVQVGEKEKTQSATIEEQARKDSLRLKYERWIARLELDCKEQQTRTKLEHLQKTRKIKHLARFLPSVSSPSLYYLPRLHTKETEDLVEASMEACQEKIAAQERQVELNLQQIETEIKCNIEKYEKLLESLNDDSLPHENDPVADQDSLESNSKAESPKE